MYKTVCNEAVAAKTSALAPSNSFNSALETWLGTVRTSVQGPGYMHGHGQPSGLGCHTVTIQWQPQGV